MISNHLKIAFRSILKNRFFSFINVFGLSLGMICVIMIAIYIVHETGYDRFHRNGDRIYRVLRVNQDAHGLNHVAVTSAPYADAMANELPDDLESITRVAPNDGLISYNGTSFSEKKLYYADANFFQFFSYTLTKGDPASVLSNPNDVVLTEATARKYFGEENPIGKIIRLDNEIDLKVTGIAKSAPNNSHLNFDVVANLTLFKDRKWYSNWWNNFLFTYITLKPGIIAALTEQKLPAFMDKYFGEDFKKQGRRMDLSLQPLQSIYLDHHTQFDLIPHGNDQSLFVFLCVSLMVLLIAALNFMNLSTAKSAMRAKEVGLRKVVGAHRRTLMVQFLAESSIVAFIALTLALTGTELVLLYMNAFLEKELSWTSDPLLFLPYFILGTLMMGGLAGLYPALVLSSFKPVDALKYQLHSGTQRSRLWKAVVIAQFGIATFLIIAVITMFAQFDFIQSKNLGFDKDEILLVPLDNSDIRKNIESFKDRLAANPSIIQASSMSGEPGGFHDKFGFEIEGKTSNESFMMRTVFADFNYTKTFGLKIVAGRNFSKEFGTDKDGILLNETAARALGWSPDEALGKKMKITLLRDSDTKTVIGVVKDYHFESLKDEIQPLAISIHADNRICAVKIKSDDVQESIMHIEKTWMQLAAAYPFEYKFLDQRLDRLYRNEQKQSRLIIVFSVFAIVIACLGLLGLAIFDAEKRTKEIGVRKVLGAGTMQITGTLVRKFLTLVMTANIIAVPLAYLAMKTWLENFAYRTDQNAFTYLMAALIAVCIAMLTIGLQAIKTARGNPVNALKHE